MIQSYKQSHRVVRAQWETIEKLREVTSTIDYQHEKACITEVLENVDEARIQFEVRASFMICYFRPKRFVVIAGHRH